MDQLIESSHITYLFDGLLLIFTLSATLLGAITVSNAMRLRNVQMSWKGGHLYGYPLFSSLFLVFSIGLLFFAFMYKPESIIKVSAYNWIGLNWFMVSHIASKVYITDYGIVKNINDPTQTIAWYQVMDLVERRDEDRTIFTFLYFNKERGRQAQKQEKCVRFEIVIPGRKRKAFRKILTFKLGRRFSCQFTKQDNFERLP